MEGDKWLHTWWFNGVGGVHLLKPVADRQVSSLCTELAGLYSEFISQPSKM